MPRRPTRTVPTVILHGWRGPGPAPWQDWLAAQLRDAGREVRFPQLPNPQAPVLATWLAALRETLAGLPDAGFDVVAHSLGAVLWLHHVAEPDGSPRPARVALVAPPTATPLPSGAPPIPSPAAAASEIAEYFPVPLDVDVVRHAAEGTVLVGGDDDPYAPEGVAAAYGRPLKMATTVLAGGGHVNAESGFDEWPAMLSWCNRDNLAFY